MIGASIQVEGTSNGCITDIDGNYTLPNVPANATLVFSYIGYQTQKIAVGGKTKIDVKLAEDSQLLQEVVVVGYGVQRKSDLTGAVASVKAADALKNTPTGNVSDALQGRMAGVSVLSGSGNPTEDNTIRVRGINSVSYTHLLIENTLFPLTKQFVPLYENKVFFYTETKCSLMLEQTVLCCELTD